MSDEKDSRLSQATVLFVDDEENILKSIHRGLLDEPYKKKYASSGSEALAIIEQEPIQVLVTDMRMPGMDGLALIRLVAEKKPDIVRIILTGYSHVSTLISAINTGQVFRYLTKPWRAETEFIPAVRQAIAFYQLRQERDEVVQKLKTSNLEMNKKNIEMNIKIKQNESLLTRQQEHLQASREILSIITREIVPFLDFVSFLGNADYPLNAGDRKRMAEKAAATKGVIESISTMLQASQGS